MWPRRSRQGDNWTSVVFSPGRIDIAEVRRRTDERPVVSGWESFVLEGTESDALKRLRTRLQQGRCTTLLRHGQYQMLQVEAPSLPAGTPPEERRQAVRWRVKEMVDFPVEQAGVDVLDIPAAQGGGRPPQMFAVVASHAELTPRVRMFQDAKVPLEAIDIPELAQRNVAALFEEPNRGLALLAFDDDGGRLTFTYCGELYAMRHIEIGLKELAAPGGDVPGGVFERVLLDVQRSLDNFDRNFSFVTLTRLLVAPIPGAAAFVDYLKGNLYQPVELLNLADGLDCGQVPALADPERQAEALQAIGAALREEVKAPA
jgi:MSHA biogenesis protein MshI